MTWVKENGAAGGGKLRLLVVEPGPALYREALFGALCELPDFAVSFASGMGQGTDWAKKYCRHAIEFNYRDGGLAEAVENFRRQTGESFDGVLTYTEAAVHHTNELSHVLGVPVISRFRDRSIRNKGIAREKISRVTDAQPWFRRLASEVELKALLKEELSFPLIVKPAEMMRGLAAIRVDNKIQLKAAYYRACNADFWNEKLRPLFQDISNEVLVEEFIDGPEYGVEVMVQHGKSTVLGITKKFLCSGNNFEDAGHCFPAPDVPENTRTQIEDLMRKVHAGLMIENSLTNAEIRVRRDKVYLLEINCRVTDDHVSDLIEKAYGISLARILADLHCGREVQWTPPRKVSVPYEVRFLSTEKEGRVISISKPALPKEVEYQNHLACGSLLFRGGLGGESRLGHAIFPMGQWEAHTSNWTIQSPAHWENSIFDSEPIFIFEAFYSDLTALFPLFKKSDGERLSVLRRRHSLNPSALFFAASAERRETLAAAQVLPLSVGPQDPLLNQRLYWERSVNSAHFQQLGRPNVLHVLSLTTADSAPPDARAILLRGILKWASQQGYTTVREVHPTERGDTELKHLRSFKEYYEGLLSRKYPEEFYTVALDLGGSAKGFVKHYFQDSLRPDSGLSNYGVVIEYDLRELP
ncbi:MAG: ATP-grasp domain-containing protein [Bdellovibrionales bacterium]|nr:ATP-grasp domain-containing protein [Bdellovibrionales bacterium]